MGAGRGKEGAAPGGRGGKRKRVRRSRAKILVPSQWDWNNESAFLWRGVEEF